MKKEDKNQDKSKGENPGESYRESGVRGNDQNSAWREAGKSEDQEVPGNAEPSERGHDEFLTDNGIHRELDESSEGHAPKHSERAKREFEEDQELHQGLDD